MSNSEAPKTMIVIYDKANTLQLPYKEGEGKKTKTRMFKFKPGNNDIEPKVWDAIQKELGPERFEHYERHMKIKAVEGTRRGSLVDLDTDEFIKVIENTMTIPELENCRELEKGKTKGNQSKDVLNAITAQLKLVRKTEKELKDAQESN